MNVLILGDSMLVDVSELAGANVINACIPGETVSHVLQAEQAGLAYPERDLDAVVLCLGTNDLAMGRLAEFEVIPELLRLARGFTSRGVATAVLGFPHAPTASRSLAYHLSEQPAQFLEFPYLDAHPEWLHDDGTHLNSAGVAEMQRRLQDWVASVTPHASARV